MKLTSDNLEKIFNYIESQLEDDDGRGEFDEETTILSAVDRTIEMFKENEDEDILSESDFSQLEEQKYHVEEEL